ncbi:ABC transporter related [Delftia acidovorans SPH-1]|uniref:ABC transporter related n=1 Tax=Delftia acidovorans (strain DSM 14801 / SPH-1) TaxID=398578 RepID=A9BRS1_DELAS|nr:MULTISPECIES: ABC transporter ATP-binding protein [Delftia]MCP4018406.1 ABC transporter ATP-binding protein [Delftia sp.]OLE94869.1 MAG: ABC transporter [Delftia sp. 13_1_40CM_3_66_6]ABX33638.1 ABC transporter related [Delftia acidovorans SPH-1]MCP4514035.1 ABC transporter ATP-binding protein [Delftia sp.]MCP4530272.1 ABC transporter ATP-binding protein [Delftia sp.]
MIKVSQLVFEYPGHRALDGVSVHIAAGTVTALVGPNGAGKSTLMRCIAGLDQPLSGQVEVHGIAVQEQPREVHRHLGYLSDFFGLYDRLSVRRCLQYAALSMGVLPSEAPQRVAHVAGQLGLADLLERLPTELSRGQRQRVAIGQAIVHQPRVLLLDEPASGLDPEARASLSQLMRALQAQGMTLIVSSHILSELDEYCTHILSLRGGRVESHEALHGGIKAPAAGGDVPLALYALELAPPPGASAGSLARQLHQVVPDTPVPPPDDQGLVHLQLWLPTPPRERADLLARLVGAGLPVASLAPVRERLQDRYARGLQAAAPLSPAEQP